MPTLKLKSAAELFYEEDWLGPPWIIPEPALLIHGAGESSAAWFGWIPRMAQQFRLLRPDLPGFGRSTVGDDFEWTVSNLAAVLNEFLDQLGIEELADVDVEDAFRVLRKIRVQVSGTAQGCGQQQDRENSQGTV